MEERRNEPNKFYISKRYVFALLGFFGIFNVYALRVNLSVAMVAMVNQSFILPENTNSSSRITECPNLNQHEPRTERNEGFKGQQYNWDSQTQGRILGSFFYGYIITQIPGGILTKKWGAKWLFGGGILVTSVLSLLTPLAASWSTSSLSVLRCFEGLGEGVTYPAIIYAISTWSPMLERSRLSTLINVGASVGSIVAMPVTGWLCSTDFLGGWPSVFYVFGTVGCIWFVFWSFLIYEKPTEHPDISKEELLYIEQNKDQEQQKISGTPWKAIFMSVPVYALFVAHFGNIYGFYFILIEMPTYLSTILHFDIAANGILSALPFLAFSVVSLIASFIADKLREHKILSIRNIRKLMNTIGTVGPALCLIAVSESGCYPKLTVALLTLAMALNSFTLSGFNITHVDMCPAYAGTLYSLSNTIANIAGFLAPMTVGSFIAGGATIKNWSYVFYIAAAVYIVSGTVFALFSSAELQPWASVTQDKMKAEGSKNKLNVDEVQRVSKL